MREGDTMWEALGFLVVVLGTATSYGSLRQQVKTNRKDLDKLENTLEDDVKSLHSKIDEINRFLRDAATERALKGK